MASNTRKISPVLMAAVILLGMVSSAALAASGPGTGTSSNVTGAVAPGGILEPILFYIVAAVTVISALGVCIARNIVRMAVWLFIALSWIAFLYFLLAATFLGAIQLIVYVGGTLILLIFGVMLTSRSPWVRFDPPKMEIAAAAVVCGALLVTLCIVLCRAVWPAAEGAAPGVSVADLGRGLLTTYLVPFEVAGVLLMIVMVGAAHLARQEKK